MHRWVAVLWGFAAVGCWDPGAERARQAIRFREPSRVVVGEGQTLDELAALHGVAAADILAWNDGVPIEPGVVLVVWSAAGALPDVPLPGPQLAEARRPGKPSARRPQPARAAPAPRGAPSPRAAPALPAPALPAPADRPRSVRNAGIFAGPLDGMEDDLGLAEAAAGLAGSRGGVGVAGVRTGAGMRADQAERSGALDTRGAVAAHQAVGVPDGPVTVPSLRMPAAKRCRPQVARLQGEDAMSGGEGLSSAAIKAAMGASLGTTRRCFPPGSRGKYSVIVELNVGCDGRVKNTWPLNDGGLPAPVMDCVERVLAHAAFPAHDIPDGQSFQYPIHYAF